MPVRSDLVKQYKRLQLGDFLKAQGITDDSVSLANPELFTQLDALVGTLKPEQWKTYLRFHVGNAMAPYLSTSFRDADFEFRGRVLDPEGVGWGTGRGAVAPRGKGGAGLGAGTRAAVEAKYGGPPQL